MKTPKAVNGAANKNGAPTVINFTRERETKNCVRFAEDGDAGIVGTLYVKKLTAKDWQTLTVTLTGVRA